MARPRTRRPQAGTEQYWTTIRPRGDGTMPALSEELLAIIFSYLRLSGKSEQRQEDRARLRTLRNLCFVSHACNRAVSSSLYYRLVMDNDAITKLNSLLRVFVKHPNLARKVTHLQTDYWDTNHAVEMGHVRLSPPPDSEISTILGAIHEKSSVFGTLAQQLSQGIQDGLQDAGLALLLHLCSEIRTLETIAVFGIEDTLVMQVIFHAAATGRRISSKPLQMVEDIAIAHWDTENTTDLMRLEPLLCFPSLRTLRGTMLRIGGEVDCLPSRLAELRLESSDVEPVGLASLLKVCPRLKKLSIHWGRAIEGIFSVDVNGIGEALRDHGKSLNDLSMDFRDADDEEALEGDLGSLKPLRNLRHLTVFGTRLRLPGQSLLEVLPESLQSFCTIRGDQSNIYEDEIVSLMSSSAHSSLASIRVRQNEGLNVAVVPSSWNETEEIVTGPWMDDTESWFLYERDMNPE